MRADTSKHGGFQSRRYFVPYFVLVVGLLSTAFFSYYVSRTAETKDLERFNTSSLELTTYVRGRPRLYVEVLRAATGLFAVSPSINPTQFQKFVERLELADQYPGSQGLGYLTRVKRDQKDAFDATAQQHSLKDFPAWPPEDQDEYGLAVHFEPLNRAETANLDFALHTNPVCSNAMQSARDTGLPTATAKLALPGTNNEAGFLIYVPIYKNDRTPTGVSERREALSGFVFSQFRAADFLKSVLAIKHTGDIDLQLYDGLKPSRENLLADTSLNGADPAAPARPRFTTANTVEVAGRTWAIGFASRPEFVSAANRSALYYTAFGGLLMTLVLFTLTYLQVSARSQAERSAAELRDSETKVRKTLSDRERAEEALKESEERYRDLVENANDIVYTLDLEGKVTSINKAAESITGYAREQLINRNLAELLTPESFEANRAMLTRKLEGEERTNYEMDIRSVDGRILTFEISSKLVFRDGKAIGVQGIARDITSRRHAEEALRQADQRALAEYERLLEKVAKLAQALGTARDLNVIFLGLREFALLSVPCDGLFVSLYDSIRDVRIACYGWGDGKEIDTSDLPPMPVNFTGPNSRAVRTNQVIITNDYQTETLGHPAVIIGPDNGLRPQSSLSAPMAVMGRIVGTIEVQTYDQAAYGEE